jgi:hypothetical protein
MTEQFLTFHTFPDEETATDFAENLADAHIEYKLERVQKALSDGIVGISSSPDIIIKLSPVDFEKAHQSLSHYYKKMIEDVNGDYYLFEFSNKELLEIISKPDEWGYLDYQLAQKILNDRGQSLDSAIIQKYKDDRIKELAEPGKASKSLIILGYCFFLPFGSFVSILVGRYLLYDKKTLPNGQTVFSFTDKDHRHGKRMIKIGTIILILSLIVLILRIVFFSTE